MYTALNKSIWLSPVHCAQFVYGYKSVLSTEIIYFRFKIWKFSNYSKTGHKMFFRTSINHSGFYFRILHKKQQILLNVFMSKVDSERTILWTLAMWQANRKDEKRMDSQQTQSRMAYQVVSSGQGARWLKWTQWWSDSCHSGTTHLKKKRIS